MLQRAILPQASREFSDVWEVKLHVVFGKVSSGRAMQLRSKLLHQIGWDGPSLVDFFVTEVGADGVYTCCNSDAARDSASCERVTSHLTQWHAHIRSMASRLATEMGADWFRLDLFANMGTKLNGSPSLLVNEITYPSALDDPGVRNNTHDLCEEAMQRSYHALLRGYRNATCVSDSRFADALLSRAPGICGIRAVLSPSTSERFCY